MLEAITGRIFEKNSYGTRNKKGYINDNINDVEEDEEAFYGESFFDETSFFH